MTAPDPGASREALDHTPDASRRSPNPAPARARLADLRSVDAADVYKGDVCAGSLTRHGDDVVFRYAASYLADPELPAVAWSLPKTETPVVAAAGSVPPFFAGLLPEGVRLHAVASGARTSEDDHLTLLLAVGADAIGDVRVFPAGEPPREPAAVLDEGRVAQADFQEVFTRATSIEPDQPPGVALPGVQVKVSAAMVSAPLRTSVGPAILKLNPAAGFPRLVENEHHFMGLAASCGITVPEHRLIHDRHGRAALLVARFDRVTGGEAVIRLAQEDACQVLGVFPARKYRISTEQAAAALAGVAVAGGGSGPLAMRRVLELVVFSYLIGNGDLHGKNLSVRRSPNGPWEVSPGYDLLSTQPYAGWRDPMALDLYGRANRLPRSHLLESARRLGVPERAAARTIDRIADAVEAGLPGLGAIGLPDRASEMLGELITRRLAEVREGRATNA